MAVLARALTSQYSLDLIGRCVICGAVCPPQRKDRRRRWSTCGPNHYITAWKMERRGEDPRTKLDRLCRRCGLPIPPEKSTDTAYCSNRCAVARGMMTSLPEVVFVCLLLAALPTPVDRVLWLQLRMPDVFLLLRPAIATRIARLKASKSPAPWVEAVEILASTK